MITATARVEVGMPPYRGGWRCIGEMRVRFSVQNRRAWSKVELLDKTNFTSLPTRASTDYLIRLSPSRLMILRNQWSGVCKRATFQYKSRACRLGRPISRNECDQSLEAPLAPSGIVYNFFFRHSLQMLSWVLNSSHLQSSQRAVLSHANRTTNTDQSPQNKLRLVVALHAKVCLIGLLPETVPPSSVNAPF